VVRQRTDDLVPKANEVGARLVRLSAQRELAPLDYGRLSALRAPAGRMPALRYSLYSPLDTFL
jgi:hypothetical protein